MKRGREHSWVGHPPPPPLLPRITSHLCAGSLPALRLQGKHGQGPGARTAAAAPPEQGQQAPAAAPFPAASPQLPPTPGPGSVVSEPCYLPCLAEKAAQARGEQGRGKSKAILPAELYPKGNKRSQKRHQLWLGSCGYSSGFTASYTQIVPSQKGGKFPNSHFPG